MLFVPPQIWLSTWKTYTNSDFGFSFRYPSNWFVTEDGPVTKAEVEKYGRTGFYIDSIENLPNHPYSGPITSPGDVHVFIDKTLSTMDAHISQSPAGWLKQQKYGSEIGLVSDQGISNIYDKYSTVGTVGYNGYYRIGSPIRVVGMKSFDLKSGNYYFYVVTTTVYEHPNFWSQIKVRFYHWVGSKILDSFNFSK